MIDYGLVYLASQALRTLLVYHTSNVTMAIVFVLSFLVTLITLVFKVADTRYDMLLALLFPLFKLFPFLLSIRDSLNSAMEFKTHIINDRSD